MLAARGPRLCRRGPRGSDRWVSRSRRIARARPARADPEPAARTCCARARARATRHGARRALLLAPPCGERARAWAVPGDPAPLVDPMTEITVVLPTFNRAEQLCRCLDALAAQTAPTGSFEVIVVDDGSTDDTPERLKAFSAPFSLRVERQANSGQPAALNRGIAAASSATCLFLDDDI